MVHVVTPPPRTSNLLGQVLGSAAGEQGQFQLGQSRLQQGLANLRNQPLKATPSDTLANLIEASYYSPHIGRSLGPLYEQLLAQQMANQTAQGLGQGGPSGPPEEPVPVEIKESSELGTKKPSEPTLGLKEKTTQDEEDFYTDQYLNQVRPDLKATGSVFGAVPTFNYEMKSDLRPEEEAAIRQDLVAKKVNPQAQEKIVNRLREGVKAKYVESIQKYGIDEARRQAISQKWQNFSQNALGGVDAAGRPVSGKLTPYLNKYVDSNGNNLQGTREDLANHYFQYAQDFPINMTEDAMHTRAITLLQRDMDKLDKLKDLPSMPPIRDPKDAKEAIDQYKKAYQDLDRAGYIQSLKEDAFEKDMGNEEMHQALWGDQTNKEVLNEIYDLKKPKPLFTEVGLKGRFSPKFKQMEDKYLDDLSNILKKLSPTDDLVLARSMVLGNEGTIEEFNKALQKAQTGKNPLKLSEFQLGQLSDIKNPRIRPIWELFSLNGWKSMINAIRGKR